jgi:hypothetical protein
MADPNLSSFIWSVADLLRGDYKQSEYGKGDPAVHRVAAAGLRAGEDETGGPDRTGDPQKGWAEPGPFCCGSRGNISSTPRRST